VDGRDDRALASRKRNRRTDGTERRQYRKKEPPAVRGQTTYPGPEVE
jgi:hypothetical protein